MKRENEEIMKTVERIDQPELREFFQAFCALPEDLRNRLLDAFKKGGCTFDAFISAIVEMNGGEKQ